MNKFDEFQKFFENRSKERALRSCKNGNSVVRLNVHATINMQKMNDMTKISRAALASYAVHLLYAEFEKWLSGDQSSRFGYAEEVVEADNGGQRE